LPHGIGPMNILFRPLLLVASAIASAPAWSAPPAGAVEVWIRGFIPDRGNAGAAGEYIVERPGHPGKSIVRLLPFKVPGPSCYVTDNRGYSSAPETTARAETRFSIVPLAAGGKTLPSTNRTTAAATEEVNCADGASLATAPGKVERDTIGSPSYAEGTIQVAGQVTATNVLAAWGNGPSIDYTFDFQWAPWTGKLTSKISYGSFPATEVYARVAGGEWQPVFRGLPTASPWDLAKDMLGIGYSSSTGSITLPSVIGTWRTNDPDARFRVDIQGGNFTLIERNSAGQTNSSTVSTALQPDGAMRLSRANNDQVLAFLGFQPTLRAQILSRGPKASYINLRFDGDTLVADWYGLQVTKDNNANLKDLIQPGDKPPKAYTFTR
jgi:hypothetical protein